MKRFVIGYSGVGKSTFAKQIQTCKRDQIISAGQWAREWYMDAKGDPSGFRDELAAYASAILRADPDTAVRWIREHYDLGEPTIIEGIRNPADFAKLFDPAVDSVVRLVHRGSRIEPTAFDRGVDVICAHLEWMVTARLLEPWRFATLVFDSFDEIPKSDLAVWNPPC